MSHSDPHGAGHSIVPALHNAVLPVQLCVCVRWPPVSALHRKQSEYSDRIWFTSQLNNEPVFFYSDDLGFSWTKREIPNPHCFETVFPHKGLRWCQGSGTEPNVIEISENKKFAYIVDVKNLQNISYFIPVSLRQRDSIG